MEKHNAPGVVVCAPPLRDCLQAAGVVAFLFLPCNYYSTFAFTRKVFLLFLFMIFCENVRTRPARLLVLTVTRRNAPPGGGGDCVDLMAAGEARLHRAKKKGSNF